jgi:hypothetical protein
MFLPRRMQCAAVGNHKSTSNYLTNAQMNAAKDFEKIDKVNWREKNSQPHGKGCSSARAREKLKKKKKGASMAHHWNKYRRCMSGVMLLQCIVC